jgi:hypothetical protein
VRERAVALDREVVELLADEPELLALADAIAATQRQPPRRRPWPRLVAVAAALAGVAAAVATLPFRGGEPSLLSEALAAVGRGPVVHARIEARLPETDVVELATGRRTPQTVAIEYWFDEPRGRLRTEVRRSGVLVDDFLQTRAGVLSGRGPVEVARAAEPALDPALAGFVTRYREALARGRARRLGERELNGRRVVWLLLGAGAARERVAVDAETFEPVLVVPLDRGGRPGAFTWRVATIESVARVEADFAPPRTRPATPFRGDVRDSRPISSGQVQATVRWPALWLGESWRGLRLVSIERQTVTRGYPPATGIETTRGAGLRLRYAAEGRPSYVELSQAPSPEPAYAFAGGRSTFQGNPVPREGFAEIVELGSAPGGVPTALGQLRRDGVYVTIWASNRALCLEAARALRRVAT